MTYNRLEFLSPHTGVIYKWCFIIQLEFHISIKSTRCKKLPYTLRFTSVKMKPAVTGVDRCEEEAMFSRRKDKVL